VFGDANHVEKGDLIGWLTQSDTPVAAAHSLYQAILDKRLQDLEQEELGKRIGFGNVGNTAEPSVICCAIHQNADCIVGLACQTHRRSSLTLSDQYGRQFRIIPERNPKNLNSPITFCFPRQISRLESVPCAFCGADMSFWSLNFMLH